MRESNAGSPGPLTDELGVYLDAVIVTEQSVKLNTWGWRRCITSCTYERLLSRECGKRSCDEVTICSTACLCEDLRSLQYRIYPFMLVGRAQGQHTGAFDCVAYWPARPSTNTTRTIILLPMWRQSETALVPVIVTRCLVDHVSSARERS